MEAGACASAPGPESVDVEVHMRAVYVLRSGHVFDALKAQVPADARSSVTVWIHSSTLGIEDKCVHGMSRVSRILAQDPEAHDVGASPPVAAPALRMLIAKLGAYEPALVDSIRVLVGDETEVHRVGDRAFALCSNLREVVLPRSITRVGPCAFEGCGALMSATLPDALVYIGEAAFGGCKSLPSVVLPSSLTRVAKSTFAQCSISLASVTLPNSLTRIGEGAFEQCASLTSVALPRSLAHIERGAFRHTSLTSVTLPSSLTRLGGCAFEGCWALTSVTLPNAVNYIAL
jgi:hypothetical protein